MSAQFGKPMPKSGIMRVRSVDPLVSLTRDSESESTRNAGSYRVCPGSLGFLWTELLSGSAGRRRPPPLWTGITIRNCELETESGQTGQTSQVKIPTRPTPTKIRTHYQILTLENQTRARFTTLRRERIQWLNSFFCKDVVRVAR